MSTCVPPIIFVIVFILKVFWFDAYFLEKDF
jgi:hypothetical protein